MKKSLMSTNSIISILAAYALIFWVVFGISFISSMPTDQAEKAFDWKVMNHKAIEQKQFNAVCNSLIDIAMPLVSTLYSVMADNVESIALHMRERHERNKKHKPKIIERINNEVDEIQEQLKTVTQKVIPLEKTLSSKLSSFKSSVASICFAFINQALKHIGD